MIYGTSANVTTMFYTFNRRELIITESYWRFNGHTLRTELNPCLVT